MKKFLTFTASIFLPLLSISADSTNPEESMQNEQSTAPNDAMQPPKAPETTIDETAPSGYQQLSDAMKAFSDQLTTANKTIFCNVFNDMQRQNAMDMAGTHTPSGAVLTADAAVELVAKSNNLLPANSQTGACKVR